MLRVHQAARDSTKKRSSVSGNGRQRGKLLTIAQIKSRYPSEWILLKDPVVGKGLRITRGEVVAHSKDRDEVYRRDIELRLKRSATLYTGTLPENAAIVL